MSACPSVRVEQLGSHLTDYHEILCLIIFLKFAEKIQISLKPENNGYFICRYIYIFYHISLSSCLV